MTDNVHGSVTYNPNCQSEHLIDGEMAAAAFSDTIRNNHERSNAPTIPRPHYRTRRSPERIYAEPSGNGVSGDSNPTGSMLGSGPGEGGDDAATNRWGRQSSNGDEMRGNPDTGAKDASENASLKQRSRKRTKTALFSRIMTAPWIAPKGRRGKRRRSNGRIVGRFRSRRA